MTSMLEEHWYINIFRAIMSSLDSVIYKILEGLYNVFFNIADATILQPEMIKALFGRVQLILGIIILFKLVISFFTGIVNPEGFSDEKKGFGGVLKRIVVTLVMLLMLVPLNIPAADLGDGGMGSWNKNMNNHGILFGSMYELQKRVLKGNIIMNLVMGDQFENEEMSKTSSTYGHKFATDVLRVFLTVNVVHDGDNFDDKCKGSHTNCVCNYAADEEAFDIYFNSGSSIDQLLDTKVVNAYCDGNVSDVAEKAGFTEEYYILAYSSIWSTIVGVFFCILILSLAMDMAIRVFKLAILEIVAPIPIVSYIDPGSEKVFKSWTKMLMDTYLSVFIRIAIISFILFVLSSFSNGGIQIANSSGSVGFVSKILIYLGLIFFAREAPKFITKTLGIEGEGTGLLDGFNKLRAGGAVGLGTIGAFNASRRASIMADKENGVNPKHWWTKLGNHGKHVVAGITGGVSGVAAGVHAIGDAKDHYVRNARKAVNERNAEAIERGASGSTFFGRQKSSVVSMFTGESPANKNDREIAAAKARKSALEAINSRVSGEMVKYDWTYGASRDGNTDSSGKSLDGIKFNYKRFIAQMEEAKASGSSKVNVVDQTGHSYTIDYATAEVMKGQLLQSNENSYIQEIVAGRQEDQELTSLIADAKAKGGAYINGKLGTSGGDIDSRDSYKKTAEGLGQEIREAELKNQKAKSDDLYANKK